MARPRLVSDEKILSVMRRSALAHGPGVSLDRVADELEISTPALLKRFGSRQALMIAALHCPGQPEWIRRLHQGPGAEPLEEQLGLLFRAALAHLTEILPCVWVLRESGIPVEALFPGKKPPELALEALRRWLKLARKAGLVTAAETDTAAFAILGALQGRALHAHLTRRPFSPAAQARYTAELARLVTRSLVHCS